MLVLQQTFLPTDAIAGEPPVSLEAFWWFLGVWLLIGMPLCFGATSLLHDRWERKAASKGKEVSAFATNALAIGCVLLFVGIPISALQVTTHTLRDYDDTKSEVSEGNYQNMIQNIKSVYDVEDIISEGVRSPASEPLLTVVQDGVAYKVVYKENPDTFEPHLVMVTIPGAEITEIRKK